MNLKKPLLGLAALGLIISALSLPLPLFADFTEDVLNQISGKVDVVDYSLSNPWGALDPALGEAIATASFENVETLIGKENIGSFADLKTYQERFVALKMAVGGETGEEANNAFLEQLERAVGQDNLNTTLAAMQTFGEAQLNAILMEGTDFIRNILASIAIIWIVVSGVRLATANGDETVIQEQTRGIVWATVGLMIVILAERLITIIYGIPGAETQSLAQIPTAISEEVAGVIRWAKALIGSAAVLMIMVEGIKMIASSGEEEKITKARRAVLWIVIGLLIILVNQAFIDNLYINPVERGLAEIDPETGIPISEDRLGIGDVSQTIDIIGTIIKFILGFTGLIAFTALIYAGATMIMNIGNEELITKGKKIATSALIGIMIIIASYTLVATVIL